MFHRSTKKPPIFLGALLIFILTSMVLTFWITRHAVAAPMSVAETQTIDTIDAGPIGLTISASVPRIVGSQIAFTATVASNVGPLSFSWDFGDGLTADGPTAKHAYNVPGIYLISVIATDNTGSIQTQLTISVAPPIPPETPTTLPPQNLTINCITPVVEGDPSNCIAATSNPAGITYQWSFGDGSLGAQGAKVSHIYEASGVYEVIVTASNSAGDAQARTMVTVTPTEPKGLQIFFDQPVLRNQLTNFRAEITAGSNVVFLWTFSDGHAEPGATDETGKINHVLRVIDKLDEYRVTVTASNASGSSTASQVFEVHQAPPLGFNITHSGLAFPGEEITFFADVQAGDNVQYLWDFGDGSPMMAGDRVKHSYGATGKYPVRAIAYNDVSGVEESLVALVGVQLMRNIEINIPVVTVRPGFTIEGMTITTPTNEAYTYCWDFGDGTPLEAGTSKSHIYANAGAYIIEVYSTTSTNGCNVGDGHEEQGHAAIFVRDEKQFLPAIIGGSKILGAEPTTSPTVAPTEMPTIAPTSSPTVESATPTMTPGVTLTTSPSFTQTPTNTKFPTPSLPATDTPSPAPTTGQEATMTPVPNHTPTPGTVVLPETPTPGTVVLPPTQTPGTVVLPPPSVP